MKRILFLSHHNPFSISYGAEQRSHILLQSLVDNGYYVDVAYIGTSTKRIMTDDDRISVLPIKYHDIWPISKNAKMLRLLTINMFPASKELKDIIEYFDKKNNYKFIVCRYIQCAGLAGLEKFADKLLLDIDDLPEQSLSTNLDNSSFIKNIYHKFMINAARRNTKWWIKHSKACFLPNEQQAMMYNCMYLPNIPIQQPNAMDFTPNNKNILFIGRLDFAPNYMGMDHFISECWVTIQKQVPDSKLFIAGIGLSGDLKCKWESYNNVSVLGFVGNIRDFYALGNIVIAPIASGAGTNIKVIEALSFGKACVLSVFSTKGFENIIKNNESAVVYTSDAECISSLVSLLNDPEQCNRLADNAFNYAHKYASQKTINTIIGKYIL